MIDPTLLKTINIYPGDGTTGPWSISWAGVHPDDSTAPYISIDDVFGFIVTPATTAAPAIFEPVALIPQGGASPTVFSTLVPVPVGKQVWLRRVTEANFGLVNFHNIITVTANDLDLANKQMLFLAQESVDAAQLAVSAATDSNGLAYQALTTANFALSQVEEAIVISNQAKQEAQSAVTTANSASTASGLAVTRANEAYDRATTALAQANSALTTANAATQTANNAASAAGTAVSVANAANTKADNAVSVANSANSTANSANDKADDAVDAAAAATATANGAASAAGSATTTANTALATANGIDAKATEALSTANAASATATAASATANGIDAKAQEALDTANAADAKAQEALDTVQDAGVASFNGRTGVVVPQSGDYTADMVAYGGTDVAATLANHAGAINNRVVMNNSPGTVYGTQPDTGAQTMYSVAVAGTSSSLVRRDVDGSVAARGLVLNNWTSPPAGHYGLYSHPSGVSLGTGSQSFLFGQDGRLTAKDVTVQSELSAATANVTGELWVMNPDTAAMERVLPSSGTGAELIVLWTGPSASGVSSLDITTSDLKLLDEIVMQYGTSASSTPQYRTSLGRINTLPSGGTRLAAQAQNLQFTALVPFSGTLRILVTGANSNFTFQRIDIVRG